MILAIGLSETVCMILRHVFSISGKMQIFLCIPNLWRVCLSWRDAESYQHFSMNVRCRLGFWVDFGSRRVPKHNVLAIYSTTIAAMSVKATVKQTAVVCGAKKCQFQAHTGCQGCMSFACRRRGIKHMSALDACSHIHEPAGHRGRCPLILPGKPEWWWDL